MPLAPGTRFGPYEILSPIGAGGMGEVYKGRDTKLGREVAMKVLPPGMAEDRDRRARFEREAKVLASLNHPNIAQIYGLEGNALIMELIPGQTLQVPQPLETALHYAKQIAEALEAAHEKGITHRDLKPANIMVTPEGVVKVLDFGLATAPVQQAASDPNNSPTVTLAATEAGVIMGTAAYMSPEQAAGKPVDKRSDIWSFGVVVYELLTGTRLFGGDSVSDILADVLRAPIDFSILPLSPITSLLKRCLDRDRKTRLQAIGEARIAIQNCLANPVAAQAVTRPASRIPWLVAAAFAAGLAYTAYHRGSPPAPKVLAASIFAPDNTAFHSSRQFALSPDGQKLAFVTAEKGSSLLWVRDLQSLDARSIPGTEGTGDPFWSPDSQSLAFVIKGALKRVDVTGGPIVKLCDVGATHQGSWSSRGVILFSSLSGSGLFRVSASGGTPVPVTRLDEPAGEGSHRFPWFLPDGRHFLYTARFQGDKGLIFLGDLDSNERIEIAKADGHAAYVESSGMLLFSSGGSTAGPLMAQRLDGSTLRPVGDPVPIAESVEKANGIWASHLFSVSQDGVLAFSGSRQSRKAQLTWLDRSGKVLGTVGNPSVGLSNLRISPDGTTVAYSVNKDIWLHDLRRDNSSRFTFNNKDSESTRPAWWPDGKYLAYRQNGTFVRKLVSSGDAPAPFAGWSGARDVDFSRDGRYMAGSRFAGGSGLDIWFQPLEPLGTEPRDYVPGPAVEMAPKFAPSGDWLACEVFESLQKEVYVQSFPNPSLKYQVSTEGGESPVWSRDGKEIFFISLEGQMMAAAVRTVGGKLEIGVPKVLFDTRRIPRSIDQNYDVAADGRFLVVSQGSISSPAIHLVVNWPATLKP